MEDNRAPWEIEETEISNNDLFQLSLLEKLTSIADSLKIISDYMVSKPIKKSEEIKPEESIDKLSVIRKMAQNLIMEGHEGHVKSLLSIYGVKKLSELEAQYFDDFMKKLGEIE